MDQQSIEATLYSISAAPPARPERRTGERFLSLLRVGALLMHGRRELCLIRNVSAGGMMIRPYSVIDAGTELSVELKHGEAVAGVAQWSDNGLVGVTFEKPIDVVALLSPRGEGPAPRMPRIEISCTALVRQDADVHQTRAINISQGGMCISTNAELAIGADVIVSLPDLPPRAGVVKWREEDSYGFGFNRIFAVDELMGFLQGQQRDERSRAVGDQSGTTGAVASQVSRLRRS